MQKSVEIRSEHLWPEFRDLPREAKPWILDVCPKSFLVFLNGCVLLLCDNWFPAMAWKFGCIDCAGWNCQWVPVQLVESPRGPIHGHTHALAHTHTLWNNPQKLAASILEAYLWRSDKMVLPLKETGSGKGMADFLRQDNPVNAVTLFLWEFWAEDVGPFKKRKCRRPWYKWQSFPKKLCCGNSSKYTNCTSGKL